mmetsp:Transcript_44111/g.101970  ORF Transcript_44111/g.101970 Transcript_44111/m.101970 type:complete len:214 (-) Transcript_44111:590-1231(-)
MVAILTTVAFFRIRKLIIVGNQSRKRDLSGIRIKICSTNSSLAQIVCKAGASFARDIRSSAAIQRPATSSDQAYGAPAARQLQLIIRGADFSIAAAAPAPVRRPVATVEAAVRTLHTAPAPRSELVSVQWASVANRLADLLLTVRAARGPPTQASYAGVGIGEEAQGQPDARTTKRWMGLKSFKATGVGSQAQRTCLPIFATVSSSRPIGMRR